MKADPLRLAVFLLFALLTVVHSPPPSSPSRSTCVGSTAPLVPVDVDKLLMSDDEPFLAGDAGRDGTSSVVMRTLFFAFPLRFDSAVDVVAEAGARETGIDKSCSKVIAEVLAIGCNSLVADEDGSSSVFANAAKPKLDACRYLLVGSIAALTWEADSGFGLIGRPPLAPDVAMALSQSALWAR